MRSTEEIVIRLDMDGFRATRDLDDWKRQRYEYIVCHADHDENYQPLNLDVWQAIEQEM